VTPRSRTVLWTIQWPPTGSQLLDAAKSEYRIWNDDTYGLAICIVPTTITVVSVHSTRTNTKSHSLHFPPAVSSRRSDTLRSPSTEEQRQIIETCLLLSVLVPCPSVLYSDLLHSTTCLIVLQVCILLCIISALRPLLLPAFWCRLWFWVVWSHEQLGNAKTTLAASHTHS